MDLKNSEDYVRTRALGVARPASLITGDAGKEILSLYRDCMHQAVKIVNGVTGKPYDYYWLRDSVQPEGFADLVKKCYDTIVLYLESESADLCMRDRKEIVLAWCGDFRYCFLEFEKGVKACCLRQLPFFQKDLDFRQGVLVRSVNDLSLVQGFWGVNYPVLSTSIFTEENPNWYLKGQRDRMLIYSIDSASDVVAMFPTDSNVACLRDLEPSINSYIEKLFIDDSVEGGWFGTLYPDYQCAYTLDQLTQSDEICEIVLKSSVHPKGVLIGDSDSYEGKVKKETEIFAAYYGLPIYALVEGSVVPLDNSLSKVE